MLGRLLPESLSFVDMGCNDIGNSKLNRRAPGSEIEPHRHLSLAEDVDAMMKWFNEVWRRSGVSEDQVREVEVEQYSPSIREAI